MAHEHSVIDSDKHFKIDTTTREITNESGKVVLMQHDHNSERFTFEVPRYVEGHDMSVCNQVQIHYQNKETATDTIFDDVYEVSDFKVDETDDQTVTFSWLISGNATQYVGALNFSVRFACVADDGTVEYAWNTAAHYGVTVSSCFFNSETVVSTFSDVLEKWRSDMYLASIGEGVSVEEVRTMLGIVPIRAASVTIHASSWTDYTQTVNVEGVTADSEKCHVQIAYAPESYTDYRYSGVRCTAQGEGTVTFTCDIVPTVDIIANILIFEEQGV